MGYERDEKPIYTLPPMALLLIISLIIIGFIIINRHPLDTLKTKMQAQESHMGSSSIKVFLNTLKTEGIVGLYR